MISDAAPAGRSTARIRRGAFKGVIYLVVTGGAVASIIPFLWMLSTSFKTNSGIFQYPPSFIPSPLVVTSYVEILTQSLMLNSMGNSLKIAVINTLGTLLTASMAAYAFAKLQFRGKNVLFIILLSTMMIPIHVTLIPMFIIFKNLGWIDTHLPLIVPSMLSNAYGVFLLRQFFMTIPSSLIESAKIDGAHQPYIFARIILPLGVPSIATLGLINFLGSWNNFLTPLIYLNTRELYTVSLIVASFRGEYVAQWNKLMAGSCLALLPIILCYLFAQKYFVEGIVLTGMKS